jgi:hypothetical protein
MEYCEQILMQGTKSNCCGLFYGNVGILRYEVPNCILIGE